MSDMQKFLCPACGRFQFTDWPHSENGCPNAEAPPPIEDGADSAIAIHSAGGEGRQAPTPATALLVADDGSSSAPLARSADQSYNAPSIPQGAPLPFQTAREFRDQMDAEARDTGLALARLAEFAEGAGFESSGIKWQPDGWWAWVTGESFTDEAMGATAHEAIDNLFDVLEDME